MVVVLPTPPFWLHIEMTRAGRACRAARGREVRQRAAGRTEDRLVVLDLPGVVHLGRHGCPRCRHGFGRDRQHRRDERTRRDCEGRFAHVLTSLMSTDRLFGPTSATLDGSSTSAGHDAPDLLGPGVTGRLTSRLRLRLRSVARAVSLWSSWQGMDERGARSLLDVTCWVALRGWPPPPAPQGFGWSTTQTQVGVPRPGWSDEGLGGRPPKPRVAGGGWRVARGARVSGRAGARPRRPRAGGRR